MEIGLVENYLSDHCVILWFYERAKVGKGWKRIGIQRVHPTHRPETLKQVIRKGAKIIVLGRGT